MQTEFSPLTSRPESKFKESLSSIMSTNDEGSAPKFTALVPASNPRMPASTCPTPLGTLSILPREVRDEIYRHVCGHKYYLTSPFDPGPYFKWRTNDLATLPTVAPSKIICQEFLAALFAETIFGIHDTACIGNKPWRRDEIPFIDQVQNIVYSRSLIARSDEEYEEKGLVPYWENEKLSNLYAGTVAFFTGTEVLRKSCVIELSGLGPKAMLIFKSPFIDALERLTGFKTVTLKLTTYYDEWCPVDALSYFVGRDPA